MRSRKSRNSTSSIVLTPSFARHRFDSVDRTLYSGGGDGMLHCWSVSPSLSLQSSTNLNPPTPASVSFLHHPESTMNKATLMTNRKTVFRKSTAYSKEETLEARAGPKKGGEGVVGREEAKKRKKTAKGGALRNRTVDFTRAVQILRLLVSSAFSLLPPSPP